MPAPYRRLGRILKAHGTQGEVSVVPCGDLSFSRLTDLDVWIVPPTSKATARRITELRQGPKGVLIRISGIEGPAAAHELAGRWLLARGDEEPGAVDARDDLIGRAVRDTDRGLLGTVIDVIATGANDVLVVDGGPWGQVLIPVIDQVMIGIADSDGVLDVKLLDGLIDEDV